MISLTAQYAIRAVIHIAKEGRWCTAVEIASASNIPRGYVAKVLSALANSGILLSQRGFYGGFQFNPDFLQASLYEIVRAVEPKDRLNSISDRSPANAQADCAASRLLTEMQSDIDRRLREAKLINFLRLHKDPADSKEACDPQ